MPQQCHGVHRITFTLLAAALTLASPTPLGAAQRPSAASDKLPYCGLPPAKIFANLCTLTYPAHTASPRCQALVNQGLGFFYSYVWMEAARSFETAAVEDPSCAIAWWGLSRSLEKWGRPRQRDALKQARALLPRAPDREQLLISARLQEKGLDPSTPPGDRLCAAARTLDDLLARYDDDEEAWYGRAQLAARTGGAAAAVPYYKALLRINPLHPGANHELVHFYENCERPGLGWPYAENYIRSSPGIPHPFHMQAHLATRLGRWDKTSDRSHHAIELERAYHRDAGVKPTEDYQFPHHLEILTRSLVHDGRLEDARAVEKEVRGYGIHQELTWYALHAAARDWPAALKLADSFRKKEKTTAAYLTALAHLRQESPARARPELEILEQAFATNRTDRLLADRVKEIRGLYLCQTGGGPEGLRLLSQLAERSKNDYAHHAWGNGAYYLEQWGTAALMLGDDDAAEEAFLEALAHDPGCARAALGLQALAERQGRAEDAAPYAALARRCWRRADPGLLEAELAILRHTQPYTAQTTIGPHRGTKR